MPPEHIAIAFYQEQYQKDIDVFMASIAREFDIIFTPASVVPFQPEAYWVALRAGKAVGTIAACRLGPGEIALRKMFLDKSARGTGISQMLLDTFMSWAYENNTATVYLGTMGIFKAAQNFYKKNGFEQIKKSELPPEFIANPVDSVFYKKKVRT